MRIIPLHSVSQQGQPGSFPNGIQRQDAPPPVPDKTTQPDLRNRVEPQTDTRHAVEHFNPTSRMETSAPNRTNTSHPSSIEMGMDRQRASGQQPAVDRTGDYQEILHWIREKQQMQEAAEKSYQRVKQEFLRSQWERRDYSRERPPVETTRREKPPVSGYDYRKGVDAYRQAQNIQQGSLYTSDV